MAALLRRLGVATDEITDILSKAFRNHPVEIGAYAATSMMLRKRMISTSLDFTFGEKKDGYLETYEVTDCHHDGQAFIKTQLMMGWDSQ